MGLRHYVCRIHGTNINNRVTRHKYKWTVSHFTHMNGSCHTWHVTHMNVSCHAELCGLDTSPTEIILILNEEAARALMYTGWRRPIECLKLQVIFRKRATNYKALLRKMTYKDKACYDDMPPCTSNQSSTPVKWHRTQNIDSSCHAYWGIMSRM